MKGDEGMKFQGKRVFVTGGANGIGRGIVEAFCNEGALVAFVDIQDEAAVELTHNTGAWYIHASVANAEDLVAAMQCVFAKWGDIDILVNNAGVTRFIPLEKATLNEFDSIINTNLRPVFVASQQLALHRSSNGTQLLYGRIINIASTRWAMSEPGTEAYSASKGGIVSLTHALALSFSNYNVTVNAISPGWIDTGHFSALSEADHRQHPSGRVGVVKDISSTCLFLAQEGNDFINGQNLVVDGGMTKKMLYAE